MHHLQRLIPSFKEYTIVENRCNPPTPSTPAHRLVTETKGFFFPITHGRLSKVGHENRFEAYQYWTQLSSLQPNEFHLLYEIFIEDLEA
jgi:hypothetical protein